MGKLAGISTIASQCCSHTRLQREKYVVWFFYFMIRKRFFDCSDQLVVASWSLFMLERLNRPKLAHIQNPEIWVIRRLAEHVQVEAQLAAGLTYKQIVFLDVWIRIILL
uniref:AlNc14C474G11848 protein n=1 Tax=Albugo laibachii Nc14 TaxID=890382 RepID=F0X0B1_9STRA|nr:AlNc14C474G11848 [Albugo laibachii Nc14]|eukprot:CCA27194.1 AlNc14C474G11848 [Albugo laibachii Nc14]